MDEGAFLPRPPEGDHASGGGYRNQQPKRRKSPLHSILWRLTGKYFDNRPASHGKRGGIRQVLLSNRDPNMDLDILCRISASSPTGFSPPFFRFGKLHLDTMAEWGDRRPRNHKCCWSGACSKATSTIFLSLGLSHWPIGENRSIKKNIFWMEGAMERLQNIHLLEKRESGCSCCIPHSGITEKTRFLLSSVQKPLPLSIPACVRVCVCSSGLWPPSSQ